jgi:Leucine-rich repeat (LRR) protein
LFLAQDLNDQSILYLATLGGHVDVVEYLLSFRLQTLTSKDIDNFKQRTSLKSVHTTHLSDKHSSSDNMNKLIEYLSTLDKNHSFVNPLNLDIYANNGRTAFHEAIEQGNIRLVQLLVSHGANVNLSYEEIANRSNHVDQCFITRSTALSTVCRRGNCQLIEYLLTSLATDKEFLAFSACQASYLHGYLLKYRALQDHEYKLTKRQLTSNNVCKFDDEFWLNIDLSKIWMNTNDERKDDNNNTIAESTYSHEPVLKRRSSKRYQILTTSFEQIRHRFAARTNLPTTNSSISPLLPIPSTSVGIQWHHYGPLKKLDPLWFIQASIFVNKDSFTQLSDINVSNRHLLFHCITRIDLSNNALEFLPVYIFQMYSLRILNVSNNQLGDLPQDAGVWLCQQLIELDVSHNALCSLPSAMFELRSLQRAYAGYR